MSAVAQNQPVMVEIKGFKTSHFLKRKTAFLGVGVKPSASIRIL